LIYDDPAVTLICGRFKNCMCRASFFTLFSFFFSSSPLVLSWRRRRFPKSVTFTCTIRSVCLYLVTPHQVPPDRVLRWGGMSRADAYIICNMQGCAVGTDFFLHPLIIIYMKFISSCVFSFWVKWPYTVLWPFDKTIMAIVWHALHRKSK